MELCAFYYPELADFFDKENMTRAKRRLLSKMEKVAKRHAVKEAEREAVRKTRRHHLAENRKNGTMTIVAFYLLAIG